MVTNKDIFFKTFFSLIERYLLKNYIEDEFILCLYVSLFF
jgi:hypothetical protein